MKSRLMSLGLIVFLVVQFTAATHARSITIGTPSAPSSVYVKQPFTVTWEIAGADSTYKSTLQRKVNSGAWTTASSIFSGSGTFQDSEAISVSGTVQYRVKVERWIVNRYGEIEKILIGYSAITSVSVKAPVITLSAPTTANINTYFQVTWSVTNAYSGYSTTLQYRINSGTWTNEITKTGPGYYNAYFRFSEPYVVEFRIVHNSRQISSIKQTVIKVPDIVFWGKDHTLLDFDQTGTGEICMTTIGNDFNVLMKVSTYWDIYRARSGTARIIFSVTFTAPVSGYYYVQSRWKFDGKYFDDDRIGPQTYMNLSATFYHGTFSSLLDSKAWGEPVYKTRNTRWYNQIILFSFGNAQSGAYLDKGMSYELRIILEMGASGAFPGSATDYIDFYNYAGFFLQKTWIKFGRM